MDLFLNELSIEHAHKEIAIEKFVLLCNTWKVAKKLGFKFIKTTSDFQAKPFAPNFFFRKLIDEIDADLRTLMLDNLLTTPYIDELQEQKEVDDKKLFAFKFEDLDCIGLGAASDWLFNSISISFNAKNTWNHAFIPIKAESFDDITDFSEKILVRNIADIKQIDCHTIFIDKKRKQSINSGRELCLKREELFPNLVFVGEFVKQIKTMSQNEPNFNNIVEILFDLDAYFSTWNGSFDATKIVSRFEIAPSESQETLNLFSSERTFTLYGEVRKVFAPHVKMNYNKRRIYFYPDNLTMKGYIGHFGHLRIYTFQH